MFCAKHFPYRVLAPQHRQNFSRHCRDLFNLTFADDQTEWRVSRDWHRDRKPLLDRRREREGTTGQMKPGERAGAEQCPGRRDRFIIVIAKATMVFGAALAQRNCTRLPSRKWPSSRFDTDATRASQRGYECCNRNPLCRRRGWCFARSRPVPPPGFARLPAQGCPSRRRGPGTVARRDRHGSGSSGTAR